MTVTHTSGAELQLSRLGKRYAGTAAVESVDLNVASGEFLTLLGPSGSGKTTTLSMVAGFTAPTNGSVVCDGAEITSVPPHRRGLGMVFQNYSLFPHLTVRENVEFPLRQRGIAKPERVKRALAALDLVELGARANAKPGQLSGGQQQRVALARALVFEPRLLLMDEPFGALDRALRERLQLELRRLHHELGITVVFVTHDQEEALTLSDRIAVFNEGRIEQVGTPEELYERPATLFVARFIGESNALAGDVSAGVFVSGSGVRVPAADLPDGPAVAVVRPERIRVHDPDSAGHECVLDGVVADITYLGAQRRVEIATEDGTVIVRSGVETLAPEVGARVRLAWSTERTAVFPTKHSETETRNAWTETLAQSTSSSLS
ncbi:ABC transporter ATP-binding protein [Leucobacter luti]|uniref:Spermidine/putrescine import ATP-binding protein PotA n=1 Tax=Leucobacter luti TaxID=340320 RepID=A0A4Q7TT23_9MICO|nr:ABC transporter ATP-binding protein [Leucobacter luti]MBL3699823.1 ABC transporter ATP-binding protein [Leucobacter luti]RZT62858.1 putative spermidine/putrescine transport system ATP-binding protein [Leucobacter luti]